MVNAETRGRYRGSSTKRVEFRDRAGSVGIKAKEVRVSAQLTSRATLHGSIAESLFPAPQAGVNISVNKQLEPGVI